METPEEKSLRIRELEIKLIELVHEREDVHRKCDVESDPRRRATYWIKIGNVEDAIHKLRNELVVQKLAS
jgi:hypothetical protein